MPKDFIHLISYLRARELQVLRSQLDGNKIRYTVNGHGATIGYEDDDYYEIRVAGEDYPTAKRIANKFKASNFIKSRQCPKCKSTLYEPAKNLSFFQKIFFLGTTPVQCKKCKTKYPL